MENSKTIMMAAAVVAFGSPVLADGPSTVAPIVAPMPPVVADNFWTGAYVGGALGYGSSNYDVYADYVQPAPPFSLSLDLPDLGGQGALAALQLGYNFAVSDQVILGVQVDGTWTNIVNDTSITIVTPGPTGTFSYELSPAEMYTISGRAGYLVSPSTQVYGLLGYTRAQYNGDIFITGPGSSSYSFDRDGVTVGFGMETRLGENVSLGIEYRYTRMEDYTFYNGPLFGGNLDVGFESSVQSVRALVNFHF